MIERKKVEKEKKNVVVYRHVVLISKLFANFKVRLAARQKSVSVRKSGQNVKMVNLCVMCWSSMDKFKKHVSVLWRINVIRKI